MILGRGGNRSREQEFTDFVRTRQSHLRRIAVAVCGDPHRAEDVLQVALTKLYVAWPRVQRDGREEAYARQIIVRADIDDRRRPWRRESALREGFDAPAPVDASTEDRSVLFEALQSLPGLQRRAVLLRHWLGLSVAEAAAELNVSQSTVKTSTARGIAALRRSLHEPLEDSDGEVERPAAVDGLFIDHVGPGVLRWP